MQVLSLSTRRGLLFFICMVAFLACSKPNPIRFVSQSQDDIRKTTHFVSGNEYVISSEGETAARAAKEIFSQGGNIFDAAVAASFAISVERPQNTGIGGGGFMILRDAESGVLRAVDFRETAPSRATSTMFQSPDGEVVIMRSQEGALAAGVPGMVRGLLEVHREWGVLPLEKVMEPAIRAAEEGFRVYHHLAETFRSSEAKLRKFSESRKIFFKKDGSLYEEGDLFIQKDLAKVLRAISKEGDQPFYEGWIAKAIVASQKKNGGLMDHEDLKNYKVMFRDPIQAKFRDYTIVTMPPPSSGGVHLLQMLRMLEILDLDSKDPYAVSNIHKIISVMQRAFADRAKYMGDTDFIQAPIRGLLSDGYLSSVTRSIDMERLKPALEISMEDPHPYESSDTIHFSIMDKKGNVVAATETINGEFGSGLVVEGTGILLNNEMDDFSSKPGVANLFGVVTSRANEVEPGKRPLSSMTPTLVMKDQKPVLALGSPSGPRIINCVLLTILNRLVFDMSLYESVSAMRFHNQWLPDQTLVEDPGFPKSVRAELESMGHVFVSWREKASPCRIQAVEYAEGTLKAVADPRRDGLALGEGEK